jgi:hypothetical protein
MDKEERKFFEEALKVYKIPEEFVFSSRIDRENNEVVIVTAGGKKLRHRKGEAAKAKLSEVDITGILPEVEMVWDSKLNQRRPKDK